MRDLSLQMIGRVILTDQGSCRGRERESISHFVLKTRAWSLSPVLLPLGNPLGCNALVRVMEVHLGFLPGLLSFIVILLLIMMLPGTCTKHLLSLCPMKPSKSDRFDIAFYGHIQALTQHVCKTIWRHNTREPPHFSGQNAMGKGFGAPSRPHTRSGWCPQLPILWNFRENLVYAYCW